MTLLDLEPELALTEIAEKLKINLKTTSGHVRRLIVSGLIMKKSQGNIVHHRLSKRGEAVLKFLRVIE